MESGFNIDTVSSSFPEGFPIEIGESSRFSYYIVRRNGVLHFVKEPTEKYKNDLVTTLALKKEFLIGYGLNHPGIVRYYALEDNKLYEEYIEGKTLRQLLDTKDPRLLDKKFLINICSQILLALDYIHSKEIVHLDLKPENLMVTNIGGQVKIIDFSCAQSASNDSTPGYTEGYEAPEQLTGNVNVSTDIFLVGKIMDELSSATKLSKYWGKFVGKATANHTDNRFKSASEALKAVPKNYKITNKWFTNLLLLMILGGIISLIAKPPQKDNLKEQINQELLTQYPIPQDSTIEEVNREETFKPIEPKVHIQPSEEEIERKLTKMISQKLDELYSLKVIPMYNKMMADEEYKYTLGTDPEFVNKCLEAYDQLELYGEGLKKQYPSRGEFIDERVRITFETRTGKMREKLYPRMEETTSEESEIGETPQCESN
ncbi:MAG: protein kinase [Muribaculaceae bacterium]|nr:protein kinase [Muribaculaceae bacterium]